MAKHRGLNISAGVPMYVYDINPADNTIVLGTDKQLYTKKLTAKDINMISVPFLEKPVRLKAKVRYRHPEQWATVTQTDSDTLEIEFDEPQRAVTGGQAVVLYDGDIIIGGGTIR